MNLSKILLLAGVSSVLAGCGGESVPESCEQVVDKAVEMAKKSGAPLPSRDDLIKDLKSRAGGDSEQLEAACKQMLSAMNASENLQNGLLNMLK